jgi:hypothetical protein
VNLELAVLASTSGRSKQRLSPPAEDKACPPLAEVASRLCVMPEVAGNLAIYLSRNKKGAERLKLYRSSQRQQKKNMTISNESDLVFIPFSLF